MTKSWQEVWQRGVAPLLPTKGLELLAKALADDDSRLLQGKTMIPPPLICTQDFSVDAACAIGFCGWQGQNLETVAEVEEFFASVCFEVDQLLGEPAAIQWFINAYDEMPRAEMRAAFLPEVEAELARRKQSESEGGYLASDNHAGVGADDVLQMSAHARHCAVK